MCGRLRRSLPLGPKGPKARGARGDIPGLDDFAVVYVTYECELLEFVLQKSVF